MNADALVKLVVGKLGSGKTAYAVNAMLNALMCGQVVVSNVRLIRDACERYFGKVKVPWENYHFVPTEDIADDVDILLTHLSDGACLVIDEVHLFMNARRWKENQTKAEQFLLFLTQARKFSIDCYILTQDERNADAQLVRQATHIIRLMNWRHMPLLGALFPVPLTVARICKPDGVTAVGKEYLMRRMPLLTCYDTHQKFSGVQLTGKPALPVIGKRARRMSYGAVLMGCGAVLVFVDFALKWKRERGAKEREEREALELAKHPPKPVAVPKAAAVMPAVPPAGAGAFKPDRPEAVTKGERARMESQLPPVYRCTPGMIVLVGGQRIGHGSFFLCGTVKGWKLDGGTVLLTLNCSEIPQLRLFHGNQPRPLLYDYDGGLVRRASRVDGGIAPNVDSGRPALDGSGLGNGQGLKQSTTLYVPGKDAVGSQLYIPGETSSASMLGDLEAGAATRLDTPAPLRGPPRALTDG